MPEFRKDPVTGRWIIISTDRAKRPGDFIRNQVIAQNPGTCPFCPGQEGKTPPEVLAFRDHGKPNEPGWTTRVMPNKFPALRVEGNFDREADGLYDRMNGVGAHEVIVETPEHVVSLAETNEQQIVNSFWAFRERLLDLKRDRRLKYALFFKNHGETAGSSLEHTHSQLIALPIVPQRVQEEFDGSLQYFDYHERCIFCDIIRQERKANVRVILENEHAIVLAPYASIFPFESWVIPKQHQSHLENTAMEVIRSFASALHTLLQKIDRALERPPYNFVLHTGPMQESDMEHFHWHLEVVPRLTRIAGFEWGTGFYINPTPPEEAAQFLKETAV